MALLPAFDNGRFLSLLRPPAQPADNWTLTIVLRVELLFLNPADVPGGSIEDTDQVRFPIRDWTADERRQYASRFQYHCQRYWDNRFWLETPRSFSELNWPPNRPTHRPNVWCRFQLELVTGQASHARPRVVHLLDGERRSFRSHSTLYDHRDVEAANGQVAVIHEVGHLLRMPHSGQHYPSCVTHGQYCYGRAPSERQNAMGSGMLFDPTNALPWQLRIARHTATDEKHWPAFLRHPSGHLQGRDAPQPLPALDLVDSLVGQWQRQQAPRGRAASRR